MATLTNDIVRGLILRALEPKLAEFGSPVNDNTNLMKLGIVDSADLLEVIILLEDKAGAEFNPEGLDIEEGLTLGQLIKAFLSGSSSLS